MITLPYTLATIKEPIENLPPVRCYVTRSVRGFPYDVLASMRVVRRKRDGKLIWRTDASHVPSGGRKLLEIGIRQGTKKATEYFADIPHSLHNRELQ